MLNLVTNALKFTHTGFVKVKAYILNLPHIDSSNFKSTNNIKNLQETIVEDPDDEMHRSNMLSDLYLMSSSSLTDLDKRGTTYLEGT